MCNLSYPQAAPQDAEVDVPQQAGKPVESSKPASMIGHVAAQ